MPEGKPTPGPWLLGKDGILIVGGEWDNRRFSTLTYPACKDCPPEEIQANARLMRLAPEMFEALRLIHEDLKTGYIAQNSVRADKHRDKHQERIQQVLAKAEGRA